MKLSELSYRDYIAIEVVGHLAGQMLDKDAAWRAYGVADAMLARMDLNSYDEIRWKSRAENADNALQILRDTLKSMLGEKADENPEGTIKGLRALFGVSVP